MKEQIIKLLSESSLNFKEIKEKLNFNSPKKLDEILRELGREDKIYYRRFDEKYYIKNDETAIGIFRETRQDFGFVELEDGFSVFIPAKFVQSSFNGDTVKIVIFPLREGEDPNKRAGKVVRIMKRNGGNIVGRIQIEQGNIIFSSDDSPKKHEYILSNAEFDLHDGDIIVTKFIDFKENKVILKPVEKLGLASDANIDYLVVAKKQELRMDFPHEVQQEAAKVDRTILKNNRKDLTNDLIVTIDGEASKDLDDAIDVSRLENGNFKLRVHIADVAHYVKSNSEIDKEAFERGTSVYLIDHVFPMLPQILSNDMASLNPDTDKYTMTCEMIIDSLGNVIKYDVYESVTKSKYKLTYTEVDQLINGTLESVRNDSKVSKMLQDAFELSKIIRSKKIENGMIDFVLVEPKFILDDKGNPTEIIEKLQTPSEAMIEDLMVVTNESVAKLLEENDLVGVYRIHGKPLIENLTKFVNIAKIFGKYINKNIDDITSKDLAQFVTTLGQEEADDLLKKYLIQTMEKAIYSPDNMGHYALGLEYYLHFTSPIRRYPDLIVHRIIKEFYLSNNKDPHSKDEYLKYATKWLSDKERIAMVSERKLMDIKKARFMRNNIGKTIKGTIASVTNFGLFVDLKHQIQGLVRLEMMTDDEYYHDESKFSIIGKKDKKQYKLGDSIEVTIIDVDTVRGLVNLKL